MDASAREEFGDRLKGYRRAAGLTQEELAESASVSVDTISNLERGMPHVPRRDTLHLIAQALMLSPQESEDFFTAARLAQVLSRTARLPHAPETSAATASSPIPLAPAPLLGRDLELVAAQNMLNNPTIRLLTITGVGGVGKTYFAFELARALAPSFADGVRVVHLASIRDSRLVPAAIAAVIGLRETGSAGYADIVTQHLREKSTLLVLDNFEHVLAASTLIAKMLALCPDLRVLATSRSLLHLRGEYDFCLDPLPTPVESDHSSIESLSVIPSVALFVQRAQAIRPAFSLDAENAADIASICRRLDGLPLAIELAAARSRILSPRALLTRLELARLPTLVDGARDLPSRQRTLRDTLTWSYDLLTPEARIVFRCLAVFAGGFALDAAESVCRAPSVPLASSDDVFDALVTLMDHSLLRHHSGDADTELRFEQLESVREFGLELLEVSGEREMTQRAHAAWCLELAEQAEVGLRGQQMAIWLERLDAERNNLRAALTWALSGGDRTVASRLAAALWRYWFLRGLYTEGRRWLESVLEALDLHAFSTANAPTNEELVRIDKVLYGIGSLARPQGDLLRARAAFERSLAIREQLGNRQLLGHVYNALGAVEQQAGHSTSALVLFEQSLAIKRDMQDQVGIANTLTSLALLHLYERDLDRAAASCEECVNISHTLGNPEPEAWGLATLAQVEMQRGNLDVAANLVNKSLVLRRKLGDKRGILNSLGVLGEIKHKQGDSAAAVELYRQALQLALNVGVTEGIIECLVAMSLAYRDWQLPAEAARLLAAVRTFREASGIETQFGPENTEQHLKDDLCAMLGPGNFDAAWKDGESLTIDSAITLAFHWSLPTMNTEAAEIRAPND